ncbi:MAG: crotonase/enoyl-CoA hydratase family protein [Pseudomonadota bacterium]
MADIDITLDGAVQIVRFNRAAKKNAITRAMYAQMAKALTDADANDAIRVTAFLGQPEVFTSGNDLMDFLSVAQGGEHGTEVQDFLRAMITCQTPVVAGVDGLAVGVGCTMLMHCDMVFASPRAWLQTPFVDLGLVPEAGSSLLGPSIMGYQHAFALLAMGERFPAQKAQDAGLVHSIVEPELVDQSTLAAARMLSEKPPQALATARRLLRGNTAPLMERMQEEGGLFAEALKSDEARNAFMAFMSKKAG